ncbi:MAG: PAS domain S-box protein [Candidatus Competibacteraceae bacterium]|nr:PAS domain S-box protein [Candidatus Competibacteraceae bacterium]
MNMQIEAEPQKARTGLAHDSALYRRLLEAANQGIWQTDAELRITFVNERMADMLGYPVELMLQRPVSDFMLPEDLADHERRWRLQRRGGHARFERRLRHRDGHALTFLVSVTPMLDERGAFRGAFAMLTDISERKRVGNALLESEQRLRTLINAMPDAVCFKDGEGRWLEANASSLKVFQLEGRDYRGRKDSELMEFNGFYRDALLACERSDQQAWTSGQLSRHDEIIPQPDGSTRIFDVIKVPTFYPDGRRKGLIVVGRDITERRQAEEALRESESRYRQLFELESDAILLIDNDTGRILEANSAAVDLYGYSRGELLQKRNVDLSAEPQQTRELTRQTSVGSKAFVPMRWLRKRDGTVFPAEITGRFFSWRGRAVHIAAIRDIAERQRILVELRASEARFRSIFELSPLGIALISKSDYRFVQANPRYCELLGYSLEALRWMTVADVTHPEDWPQSKQLLKTLSAEKRTGFTLQKRYLHQSGACRWVNITADLLTDDHGGEPLIMGIVEDITERRQAEERIRHLALHDVLTDLPNRALLEDRLGQALNEAQREQSSVALLFLDLDRFKIVNDSLGHAVGDGLLRAVAERLGHHVRGSDTVGRLGGDEFVILLTAIRDASDVARIASKLLESMAEPWRVNGYVLNVSTSIGISLYPMDGDDPDTLLQHADTALYQAKASGRNNYRFFTVAMNAQVRERMQLEQGLRQALERDELTLHYQPQVDCVSGDVVAVEALLRWRHPELGWVEPDRFVSVAEEIGLIVPIGEWALRRACRDSQLWRRAGFAHGAVALNVSALQLQRPDFSARLAEILQEAGLRPGQLELELTESLLVDDAHAATLRQLKQAGVLLSIDDFGAGCSSMSYLRRFAIDKLKLDGSFLCDLSDNTDTATIANAIIAIAHCLRLNVVAEGVETRWQVDFLRERNCRLMQGYYFGRPQSAEGLVAWWRERAEKP